MYQDKKKRTQIKGLSPVLRPLKKEDLEGRFSPSKLPRTSSIPRGENRRKTVLFLSQLSAYAI